MLSAPDAILAAILLPLVGGAGVVLFGERHRNLREAVTLVTGAVLFVIVASLTADIINGARPSLIAYEMMAGLEIKFTVEPLGQIFALVASGLWIVNSIYSIGYMRGNAEKNQTRFYLCFTIAIASSIGIAYAGNMLTLFVFYEALTLSTYPLVTHSGKPEARSGGRVYLGILMATSIMTVMGLAILSMELPMGVQQGSIGTPAVNNLQLTVALKTIPLPMLVGTVQLLSVITMVTDCLPNGNGRLWLTMTAVSPMVVELA